MKPIIIYGSKSYSELIKQIVNDCGRVCLGFIDDFDKGSNILGDFQEIVKRFSKDEIEIAIGIGYSNLLKRKEIIENVKKYYTLATLIHPKAYIAKSASIGNGSVIMAGAHIDYNVQIGQGVVCWPGSLINHDSKIEDNTFISPGVTVCGFVKIGESCFIGANSTIVDQTLVMNETFIKAHSLYSQKEKR